MNGCESTAGNCCCILPVDSHEIHECSCGGQWKGTRGEDFEVVRWPQTIMATGQKAPWADESVTNPLGTLYRLLGGDLGRLMTLLVVITLTSEQALLALVGFILLLCFLPFVLGRWL